MQWLVVLAVLAVVGIAAGVVMSRRRARAEVVISAPPERVWDAVMDFERVPSWHPDVERVEVGAEGRHVEHEKSGLTHEYRVLESSPHRVVRWRYETTAPGGDHPTSRGDWTLEFRAREGLCRVRSTVTQSRTGSALTRLFDLVRGPVSEQRLYLDCLKAHVESSA